MTTSDVILALDLSLSNAGMVAVPVSWNGDWGRVAKAHVGESVPNGSPEARHIGRLHRIAYDVLAFAERHHCSIAVCEGYAFGAKWARERLGEVGGVVKFILATRGIIVEEPFAPKAARKLMLGGEPSGDPKKAARAFLESRGLPLGWTEDEVDAMVIANAKLRAMGACAFETPVVAKKKSRRKAA